MKMTFGEGTLRYYGQAAVMLDKDTKAKLKAAAAEAHMDLWEYVRMLANQVTKNKQIKLSPEYVMNAPVAEVLEVVTKVVESKLDAKLNGWLAPGGAGHEAIKKLLNAAERQIPFKDVPDSTSGGI
jgi:antitoxin component of RelBE/YafQ-DinJ toxin-antitoxin module